MVQDLDLIAVTSLPLHLYVQAWSNIHLNFSQQIFANQVQMPSRLCEWQSMIQLELILGYLGYLNIFSRSTVCSYKIEILDSCHN